MDIETARQRLMHLPVKLETANDHENYKAILLGIEAIVRIQKARAWVVWRDIKPLPGETEVKHDRRNF